MRTESAEIWSRRAQCLAASATRRTRFAWARCSKFCSATAASAKCSRSTTPFRVHKGTTSHLLALQATAEMGECEAAAECGRAIHGAVDGTRNVQLLNAVLHFYAKRGDADAAQRVFDQIPSASRDVVSVGAMLNALCRAARPFECLSMFAALQRGEFGAALAPNLICFAIALTAATNCASLSFGRAVHAKLARTPSLRFLLRDAEIQSPLIALYGKCGRIADAERLFDDAQCIRSDIAVWNAMIHSFGRNGLSHRADALFRELCDAEDADAQSLLPRADAQTYALLLNARAK